ncbi:Olfactory Receptor 13J1 [Manis pentadactyla]|nr:Olfactory Receptor 13J1 [Manis pentadactyla]
MEPVNRTEVSEFFLKGFSGYPALEHLLFPLCSVMYLVTLLGNTAIVAVSVLDARLHTPMYFFLGNLSVLDICYTSTFVPLMLVHLLSVRKTISFIGCAIQMCLSLSTGSTECVLLAIMAYDRYLAICRPLRYSVLMSHQLCLLLAGAAWVLCLLKSVTETVITMRLPFCGHHVVSHFTCEILAVLKLACGDTSVSEVLLLAWAILLLPVPLAFICLSYTLILATILRRWPFALCLGSYSVSVLGNSLLIVLNMLDPRLHSSMYLFLSNLSLMDIWGTSSIVPLMLVNLQEAQRTVSFPGCTLQMYLTMALGTECLLLVVMAYDHYVAICQPIRYSELLSGQTRMDGVLSWKTAFANALLQSILTWSLPFCGHIIFNHSCEVLAVLELAYRDISLNVLLIVAIAVLSLAPLLLICLSYISIIAAILREPLLQAATESFPPARPTSQWWWFSLGLSPSCT